MSILRLCRLRRSGSSISSPAKLGRWRRLTATEGSRTMTPPPAKTRAPPHAQSAWGGEPSRSPCRRWARRSPRRRRGRAIRSPSSTPRAPPARRRACCCPHAQFFWWGVNTAHLLGVGADDVLCTTLPLFHTNALNTFFQALITGATVDLRDRASRPRPSSPTLAARRATVTYLLGAMVPILLSREPPSPRSASTACASRSPPACPATSMPSSRSAPACACSTATARPRPIS